MNKYTYSIAFILLNTFSLSALSQTEPSVYKWVDGEKKVHYTDRPAPGKIAEQNIEKKIRKAAGLATKKIQEETNRQYDAEAEVNPSPSDATNNNQALNTKQASKEQYSTQNTAQKKSSENYAKKLARYCKQKAKNLNTLLQDTPIAWEEKGKTILLSTKQRKEKAKNIQAIIKEKCSA